jgi:hypothetical protein
METRITTNRSLGNKKGDQDEKTEVDRNEVAYRSVSRIFRFDRQG